MDGNGIMCYAMIPVLTVYVKFQVKYLYIKKIKIHKIQGYREDMTVDN